MTSPTKAERDARLYWCDEHDRWFTGKEGCRAPVIADGWIVGDRFVTDDEFDAAIPLPER